MIILLYYKGENEAFRKYHSSCEVVVNPDTNKVDIIENDKVVDSFELVKKCSPIWTDETKFCSEIMVKIIVQPIKEKTKELVLT